MDELKTWRGNSRPGDGCFINLYQRDADHAIHCQVHQEGGFFGGCVIGSQVPGGRLVPRDSDLWCYTPAPPDWERIQQERRADAIVRDISDHERIIAELRAESEKLAMEMGIPVIKVSHD